MGSSKKSSDKDRERDREGRKKRRERSRERDRSKERSKRRSRSKDRGRERSRSRERRRDRSRSRERKRDRSRSKDRGRERSRSRERGRKRSKSRERGADQHKTKEKKASRKEKERERSPEAVVSKWDKSPASSVDGEEDLGTVQGRRGQRKNDSGDEELDRSRDRQAADPPPKREGPPDIKTSTSGDVVSMSIEETNKLRISLGLKPLQVDNGKEGTAEGEEEKKEVKKDAIHAPPKNMGAIKAAEELKEKLLTRRETRQRTQALSSVKTLGTAKEAEDEDAALWVTKMRRIAEEKKIAEKKAQMLAEMDEEFGIADLISEVVQEDKKKAYSGDALRGLKVEHDVSTFKEGRDTTLVIKDTGVLDDSEDVLLNVNMVDAEKAAKNVELKKSKPSYNPYMEEEVDELGNVKAQNLLGKYDEEIHGEKKKAFVLGEEGTVNVEVDREREIIRQRLLDKRISLETAPAQVASEYYTSEEMVQFKKVKKKRKLRKVEKVKADDLIPLGPEDSSRDHGTRDRESRSRHGRGGGRSGREGPEDMEVDSSLPEAPVDLRDEADSNVTSALMRTRRLLKHSRSGGSAGNVGVAKVVSMLQSREEGEMELGVGGGGESKDTIVLDTTAEFCRQVGGENKTGAPASRDDEDRLSDDQLGGGELEEMELEEEGGWTEVRETTGKKKKPQATDLYQEAEPLVASGVAATLQLATKKGFVSAADKAPKKPQGVIVQTSTGRRDVEYERQKEKERDRELSRYGREGSFPEKKGYTPDVKLEYVDKDGRILNTKEAFRYMSHKFHGRGSGRKKTEKRLKKIRDEHLLNSSSSVDTPLNTLAVLQSKQKAAQSPYILVSGGAQSLLAPDIAKRK